MKNERLPETSFAKKEKIENRLRKTVGMLAIGITGLGLGLYPWEGRSSAEAPDNPAAVAEQGAVDFVNAAHENPSLLGPEKTFSVDLQDGDSVNSAAQRAAEEVGEQEGWSAGQINLNIGVVRKSLTTQNTRFLQKNSLLLWSRKTPMAMARKKSFLQTQNLKLNNNVK